MEELNGILIPKLPFEPLQMVSHLMEYDGPLLSHYKDKNNKNYLFLWVDYCADYNRWLIINVHNELLFDYLTKKESLLNLFNENSFLFSIDVDSNVEYKNIRMIELSDLPEHYLPESNSFFEFDIPEIYMKNISSEAPNVFIQLMRESAYYYSLKSTNPKYAKAVKTNDAGNFLIDITDSNFEYAKADFYNKYKDDFTDIDKLNRVLSNLKKVVEPLVLDAKFSSFEVLININTIMLYDIELSKYREWHKSLMDNYYNDIIDIDYTSNDSINKLNEKFPDEELRRKIIKPIIDILVKDDYRLETRKNNGKKNLHKQITKKRYKEIISQKQEVNTKTERKKLLNLILEVTEKDGVVVFGKKDFSNNVLFQKEESEVELSLNYISLGNTEIIFKEPVTYKYYIDTDNLIHISCIDFEIDLDGQSKLEIIRNFHKDIVSTILFWIESDINKSTIDRFIEEVRSF